MSCALCCPVDDGALITMDVGLAYRDDLLSEWTEMAHSIEHRKLRCNFTATKVNKQLRHFIGN